MSRFGTESACAPFGQHEVVVRLECMGTLGTVADVDEAAVHRSRLVGHRTLEQQLALGPGGVVILQCSKIVHLLVCAQVAASNEV